MRWEGLTSCSPPPMLWLGHRGRRGVPSPGKSAGSASTFPAWSLEDRSLGFEEVANDTTQRLVYTGVHMFSCNARMCRYKYPSNGFS